MMFGTSEVVAVRRGQEAAGAVFLGSAVVWQGTVPGAPTITNDGYDGLESGEGTISLTWAAPASDGGSPVTSYQIRVSGNVLPNQAFEIEDGPRIVGGEWFAYIAESADVFDESEVVVRAVNAIGAGPWSSPVYTTPV